MQVVLSLIVLILSLSCAQAPIKYEHPKRSFEVSSKVSPCEDYHAYVCSETESKFKLPEDRPAYFFAFSDSAEAILNYKKEYFSRLKGIKAENAKEQKLKDVYMACMDPVSQREDEEAYISKIKAELNSIQDRKKLQDYIGGKMVTGDASFFDYIVLGNMDEPTFNDIVIMPSTMTFPERSYYSKPGAKDDLLAVMKAFFEALNYQDAQKRAEQVYAYEDRFAQVFPLPLEIRDLMNKKTKITEQQFLKWQNLGLKDLLDKIPSNTLMRNIAPKGFEYVNKSLGTLPIEQLKDLYLYYALRDHMEESHPSFFAQYYKLAAKYMGAAPVRPSRDERCTTLVMKTYAMELDSILWPRIFPQFPREKFIGITQTIRASLIDTLKENKWLSNKAKAGAIKKMSTAKLMLVSPENDIQWNFNPEAPVSAKTKVANEIALKKAIRLRDYSELGGKIPEDRWSMAPLDVNAYYDPSHNIFVVPVAILQAPFFDITQTEIQNLAAIGSVIGHELGHGIDDKGYLYDEVGRLRSWVTNKDKLGLKAHSRPLIEIFNKVGHNGMLTLGENTGDNVGIAASFRSIFPDYQIGKYPKEKLQEFYLQFGRVWCEVQTDSFRNMRLKVDAHSLGKERINQQVKQHGGFHEAYGCKEGDAMYLPEIKRVKIW
jgi:putative endopeptidase